MAAVHQLAEALIQAEKLAGKKYKPGKLENQLDELNKETGRFNKAAAHLKATVKTIESCILEMQNANSAMTNMLKQMDNGLVKADFGLDPNSADDRKTIDQIRKKIDVAITAYQKERTDQNDKLDELDKHLDNITGYKSPT